MKRSVDNKLLAERYLQIYEANIFSKDVITKTINTIVSDKDISDERIINWLIKAEEKFFQDNKNDEENSRSGNIKKHVMQQNDPSWASNSYDIVYTPQRIDFLKHVVDYFKTRDEDYLNKLIKKTPDDIYNKEMPVWDAQLKNPKKQSDTTNLQLNVDYKILKQWADGMKMVQPLTQKVCELEGERMGHCAGGYNPQKIQSLWDAKNEPHVTLEIQRKNQIHQIKGKGNEAPIDKYKPYIIQYIKDNKFVVKADGENIGMREYNGTYYFPDSKEWSDVYKNKILPSQRKRIEDILANIITVNENYRHPLRYSKLL